MRRIAAGLLALVTALAGTACAGGGAPAVKGGQAAAPTSPPAAQASPKTAPAGSPAAASVGANGLECPDVPTVRVPRANPDGPRATLVWDHSTTVPGTAYETEITERFKALTEQATNNRLRIDMKVAQLPAAQTLYAVQKGEVDGGTVISVYYGELYGLNWVSIPGLIQGRPDLQKSLAVLQPELARTADQYNAVGLTYGPWSRQVIFAKKEISEISAFQGMKLRSWGGQSVTTINQLGASPVSMVFGEVYVAAQRGVVDGVATGLGPGASVKLDEVMPVVNNWRYNEPLWTLYLNKDVWNSLAPDLQASLQGAATCIGSRIWAETDKEEPRVEQALAAKGVKFVDPKPGESDKLIRLARPAWDEWLQGAGPEGRQVLDKVLQAVGRQMPQS